MWSCRLFQPGLICILLAVVPCTWAAEWDRGAVFGFLEENDLFFDTDRHYTQGIKFSYLLGDGKMPGFLERFCNWVPDLGYTHETARTGFQVGQNIYTPENTAEPRLIENDRPYAGWLYVGFALHKRGLAGNIWPTLESFELQVGIIGPESLAEEAQTWVHELKGVNLPQGWANQLKTEPGLALRYWRGLRLSPSEQASRYLDVIPHAGFSIGNVETAARVGGLLRFGLNLPDDFGVQTISSLLSQEGGLSKASPAPRWGAYLFGGAEAWFVGFTTFLDGNLFRASHHVSTETTVVELKSGLAIGLRRADLALSYVYRSEEFTVQRTPNRYGSVSLRVNF